MPLAQWDPPQASDLGNQEVVNFILFQNTRFVVNCSSKKQLQNELVQCLGMKKRRVTIAAFIFIKVN